MNWDCFFCYSIMATIPSSIGLLSVLFGLDMLKDGIAGWGEALVVFAAFMLFFCAAALYILALENCRRQ